MKNMLLPTDFSRNAWNAIEYALHFFKDEKCKFYILNTYTPAFYRMDYLLGGPAMSAVPDFGLDISLEGLENTVKRIEKEYKNPNHSFEMISSFNTLSDEIREFSERRKVDMVVMGTQGATGAKEFFLGSNTVHVLRKSKVPVLVVPRSYDFKPIKDVLLPTGYESKYKAEELEPLMAIATRFKAKLHVLHALEDFELTPSQKDNKSYLKQMFKNLQDIVFVDTTEEYMPNIVHTYIEKNHVGLVVMMNRKHQFLDQLLLRHHVDMLGYHCDIPFLVLRDTSELSK
ncbi:universal stress protein [Flagellimonas sediminis]|uniref:Universal stress protein n=1 Tax=Flagellimonas sediminis TaxID=2696468 RepID=A0A6I5KUB9_9FLAO|nr:universal stress protein [Allomuricauda sediminis]NDV44123.1 universal stress protein [Allomuricauda sediminis]